MNRAFTIVELIVVIVTIAIMAAISIMAYATYQDRAADSQRQALAVAIRTGAERYFNNNNEYPLASQVNTYSNAKTVMDVSTELTDGSKGKMVACSGVCTINNTQRVYYITKPDQTNSAIQNTVTPGNGCTWTLPAADIGAVSYLIIYYSSTSGLWYTMRSINGNPVGSNSGCNFISP